MVLFLSKAVCPLRISYCYFFLLSIFGGCQSSIEKETLPFYNSADFTAEWIEPANDKYKTIHTIDTFAMHNQMGQLITKDSLQGKIYVANFFFTACPTVCPRMVSNLQVLQDTFANQSEVRLVSFSVTPWVDSVGRLKEYGEAHQINPAKWYLLTGDKDRIYTLGRLSYFAEKQLGLEKEANAFLHTESMVLIDKKSRIRGIYNATQKIDADRITEDIRLLLKE